MRVGTFVFVQIFLGISPTEKKYGGQKLTEKTFRLVTKNRFTPSQNSNSRGSPKFLTKPVNVNEEFITQVTRTSNTSKFSHHVQGNLRPTAFVMPVYLNFRTFY